MHTRVTTLNSDRSLPDSGNGTNAGIQMIPDPYLDYMEGVATRIVNHRPVPGLAMLRVISIKLP